MKMTRFTETQIIRMLKEYDSGKDTKAICREYDISRATFYNWKKLYGGIEVSQLKRLKELEDENTAKQEGYEDDFVERIQKIAQSKYLATFSLGLKYA